MEDWVVVEDDFAEQHGTPDATSSDLPQDDGPSTPPPVGRISERDAVVDKSVAPEQRQPPVGDLGTQLFSLNDLLRNASELQQAGHSWFDAYYDQFQCRLLEFKEVAATGSRKFLDRAKNETQRALWSTLLEIDRMTLDGQATGASRVESSHDSTDPPSPNTSSKRPSMARTSLGSMSDAELEDFIRANLVVDLADEPVSLYDGGDFLEWYAAAEPAFDNCLPSDSRSARSLLCAVKLYSQPDVAAAIGEVDPTKFNRWEEARDYLFLYFGRRSSEPQKHEEPPHVLE